MYTANTFPSKCDWEKQAAAVCVAQLVEVTSEKIFFLDLNSTHLLMLLSIL